MNSSSRSSTFNFSEPALGLIAALGAFLTWGALPLYFHLIDRAVSPWEILAHRILWTAALLGIVVVLWRRTDRLWRVFRAPRLLGTLGLTAALVATNWGTFIWAVVNDHVIEASLGYYINPLLNVALGFVFLGERLRRLQWIAVAIAATGVVFSVVAYGQVPWIGLILAGCFGFYGLIRKRLDVDSVTGLLVETLLLSPIALAWLIRLYATGGAAFGIAGPQTDALLIGAGVLTIVPFTLFAAGARRLRLGTIGIIQYLTPTLHFLTGVLVLHEPLTTADEVTFACIWLALAIYTIDIVASQWGTRRAARAA
ncbi:EamA family transporter RarD [Salinisphaera hydrothermalis]|uniref:RarD protein, DMT superfamily transporter n=1 Tax=Salinisphaera hydrothermalis (strain C41B8) TaxID=1304275 RepID=A0A084IPD1_SALHC|nr:EamA family transporter RarD [Salinisphaera hydrothermalis]KEZ78565.1 RarD protein, DMT superfamily transporter [Salinisphaera hydrothermalis C41B8]